MGRAALLLTLLLAAPARALPLGVSVSVSGGLGEARLAGPYRDDTTIGLSLLAGVHRHLALRLTLLDSFERVQIEARLGALLSLARAPSLRAYLIVEGGVVGASLVNTLEARAGIGVAWRPPLGVLARWTALYIESAASVRFARATQLGDTITIGVAIVPPSLW